VKSISITKLFEVMAILEQSQYGNEKCNSWKGASRDFKTHPAHPIAELNGPNVVVLYHRWTPIRLPRTISQAGCKESTRPGFAFLPARA
jgi:hypothetical protein